MRRVLFLLAALALAPGCARRRAPDTPAPEAAVEAPAVPPHKAGTWVVITDYRKARLDTLGDDHTTLLPPGTMGVIVADQYPSFNGVLVYGGTLDGRTAYLAPADLDVTAAPRPPAEPEVQVAKAEPPKPAPPKPRPAPEQVVSAAPTAPTPEPAEWGTDNSHKPPPAAPFVLGTSSRGGFQATPGAFAFGRPGSGGSGGVNVGGYTRSNGTSVGAYTRRR